jgi:hypothetical protein
MKNKWYTFCVIKKNNSMKRLIFPALLMMAVLSAGAQNNKAGILQNQEANKPADQNFVATATLKSSSRLFKDKADLTSVIVLIPAGSVVSVIDRDTTYLHVVFEDNEGYILRRHVVIDKTPVSALNPAPANQQPPEVESVQEQPDDRFTYLENKYGTTMASRIYSGKIWKGMNAEMVKDSWGTADKINRVINDNVIKEEWIFRSTWLYFENNTLLEWGPVKK